MKISIILLVLALIGVTLIGVVQNRTVMYQRHVLREYMGLEHGEHDGPELRKKAVRPIVPPKYSITEN